MKELLEEILAELEEIRSLTFDECAQRHGLMGRCQKEATRDWAAVQSIAARAARRIEGILRNLENPPA